MKNKDSLVFFGSGPVASASLQKLLDDFTVEAIVTKQGHKHPNPVEEFAKKHRIPLLYPANKQELSDLFKSSPVNSKIGLVIDYGIIISQDVINYFPLGIVNSHFSLLPQWRGADPISFAVLSGQSETGVSLMLISENLDEGLLLAQTPYEMPPHITTSELTKDLIELSNAVVAAILPMYIRGEVTPAPQEAVTIAASTRPTYSRKLTKQDGVIDWQKPASVLEREIRAFDAWPRSRTQLAGKDVIVTKAHVTHTKGKPGQIEIRDRSIILYCGQDALVLDELQPAGKKKMSGAAFLAGHQKLL